MKQFSLFDKATQGTKETRVSDEGCWSISAPQDQEPIQAG